jgi:hypothetical protein
LKQWTISKEKLRLDLFNRRFDLYMRVLDLYQELLRWQAKDEQHALYGLFIKATRESRFIFPRKSGVHSFLEEFQLHATKIVNAESQRVRLEGMNLKKAGLEESRLAEEHWILNSMFILEDKMEPYLRFKTM